MHLGIPFGSLLYQTIHRKLAYNLHLKDGGLITATMWWKLTNNFKSINKYLKNLVFTAKEKGANDQTSLQPMDDKWAYFLCNISLSNKKGPCATYIRNQLPVVDLWGFILNFIIYFFFLFIWKSLHLSCFRPLLYFVLSWLVENVKGLKYTLYLGRILGSDRINYINISIMTAKN